MVNTIKEEFMEAVTKYADCPETIFKMAKTEWEKVVAVEFFLVAKKQERLEREIIWLKYLCKAVFGVGCIGVMIQIIPKFFGV